MSSRLYRDEWDFAEAQADNLTRLLSALSRGLHLPVAVEGEANAVGFVVRLDDAPFGPMAVVHLPVGDSFQVLYRDPDELRILMADGAVRIMERVML